MYLGSAFVFVYFSSSVFCMRLAVHSSASVFCLMFKNEKLKRALHPLQLHTVCGGEIERCGFNGIDSSAF